MFGRTLLNTNQIQPTRVSADNLPQQKPGGITVDWLNSISAVGSDTTLIDGSIIRNGNKYIRYGQIMCKITGATNTATIGGSPTGGTFTLTIATDYPNPGSPSQTTTALAYNASAATVQAALVALTNVGANNVTVSGSAGGPYTITFGEILGTVVVTGSAASLTGGTPTLTIGASLGVNNTQGFYGPYDPSASDGRQTLTRGSCYVMDQTYLQYGLAGSSITAPNDVVGNAIEGGLIFLDRIIQSGAATHSLALGPTLSEFMAAFPNFRFVTN